MFQNIKPYCRQVGDGLRNRNVRSVRTLHVLSFGIIVSRTSNLGTNSVVDKSPGSMVSGTGNGGNLISIRYGRGDELSVTNVYTVYTWCIGGVVRNVRGNNDLIDRISVVIFRITRHLKLCMKFDELRRKQKTVFTYIF